MSNCKHLVEEPGEDNPQKMTDLGESANDDTSFDAFQPASKRRHAGYLEWWVGVFAALVIAGYIIIALLQALQHAIDFSGWGMDGAFQLYNPLRRIAEGEIPGVDFPVFHGIGIPVVHFPFFVLFGQNIFASELARWLVSPALFMGSAVVFMKALLRSWPAALLGTALFLSIDILQLRELITPGNSLLGLRSTVPVFIAAVLLWRLRGSRRTWHFIEVDRYLITCYVLLGLSFVMGTEQGIAAIGAFVLMRAVQAVRRLGWSPRAAAQFAVDMFATMVSVAVWVSIITLGHPIPALEYALISVPSDQGWMFGALPNSVLTPEAFWQSLIGGVALNLQYSVPRYLITCVVALALIMIARRGGLLTKSVVGVFGFMFLASIFVLIGLLGYVNLADQLAPFGRVSGLIAAGLAAMMIFRFADRTRSWPRWSARTRQVLRVVLAMASVLTILVALSMRWDEVAAGPKRSLISQAIAAYGQNDLEIVGEGWRSNLDQLNEFIPEGATIWSTYSGLIQSSRGIFTPAAGGEDYIIHVLGEERREQYQQSFVTAHPDFVVTMEPSYSTYEEWLWGRYPEFYRTLLTQYHIVTVTPANILWQRNPVVQPEIVSSEETAAETDAGFVLPANASERILYYWVTVRYEASGGSVPVLSSLPRFYLHESGAATSLGYQILPPDTQEWSFIVPVASGEGPVTLSPWISGVAPFASLDVQSVVYSQMGVPTENDDLIYRNCLVGFGGIPGRSCS